MDDSTISSAMTIISLVLSIVPVLILFWVGRRILIHVFFRLCRSTTLWARVLRGGVCLFSGLMLSAIVGVSTPRVWAPSAYLLCDGQVNVTSQGYSYKPGQQGTNIAVICTEASGKQTRITLASIFLSALLYGIVLFVLLELIGLMARTFWRESPAYRGWSPTASGSPGNARFFEDILQRVQASKQASNSAGMAVIMSGTPINQGAGDLVDRLQKLKQLREAGLIDQHEYDAKKNDLLKNL